MLRYGAGAGGGFRGIKARSRPPHEVILGVVFHLVIMPVSWSGRRCGGGSRRVVSIVVVVSRFLVVVLMFVRRSWQRGCRGVCRRGHYVCRVVIGGSGGGRGLEQGVVINVHLQVL